MEHRYPLIFGLGEQRSILRRCAPLDDGARSESGCDRFDLVCWIVGGIRSTVRTRAVRTLKIEMDFVVAAAARKSDFGLNGGDGRAAADEPFGD